MLLSASASEQNQKELEFLRIGIKTLNQENEGLKHLNESLKEILKQENKIMKQEKQENECQRGASSIMLQKVLRFVNKLIIYILPLFQCR